MFKVKLKYQSTVHGGRHGDGGRHWAGSWVKKKSASEHCWPQTQKVEVPCAAKALPHPEEGLFISAEARSVCELENCESIWGGHGRQAACRTCECLTPQEWGRSSPLSLPDSHNASWFNPFRRMLGVISLRKRTTYEEKEREREIDTWKSLSKKKKKKLTYLMIFL